MRIPKEKLVSLAHYIQTHPQFKSYKEIQYGYQYLIGELIVDIHYSEKKDKPFTFDIKRQNADPELAKMLILFAESLTVDTSPSV